MRYWLTSLKHVCGGRTNAIACRERPHGPSFPHRRSRRDEGRALKGLLAAVITISANAAHSGANFESKKLPTANRQASSRLQREFSWVIPNRLAGMPRPGSDVPMEADASFLAAQGVSLVVSLTEEPLPIAPFASRGIALAHFPVSDFSAPSVDQLARFVAEVSSVIDRGGRTAVHCAFGLGRTGTFLAAYLVHTGNTANAAIDLVRKLRPGSIETGAQEDAIRRYESHVRGSESPERK